MYILPLRRTRVRLVRVVDGRVVDKEPGVEKIGHVCGAAHFNYSPMSVTFQLQPRIGSGKVIVIGIVTAAVLVRPLLLARQRDN